MNVGDEAMGRPGSDLDAMHQLLHIKLKVIRTPLAGD